LDIAAVQRVRRLRLPEDVVNFRSEYLRRYPQGTLAAHVLGLRDVDGRGRGGVEQAYDDELRGTAGRRMLIRDARGRVVEVQDEQSVPPRHGRTVVLTIDTVLQLFVEQEIDRLLKRWKPKAAAITVVDPTTGEILAMASRPTFDPNSPKDVAAAAWKNTNIASAYEPGSTFKPFIVSWALEKGRISRDEVFHCSWGKYRMGRRLLHGHHPYGRLSVKNILIKSSNIGMAKIGERLTNSGLHQAATRFGFGRLTGCGLPGEISGTVRPLDQWTGYSTGSVPMGQEISVTPLQLIMAFAALANGGKMMSPQFVLRVSAPGTAVDRPLTKKQAGQRVVSQIVRPDVARWIVREAMTGVVARGTAKRARLKEYEVFGKTGTAQKTDPATGRYSKNRHVCSFIGGAPAANPRVLVLVVVDEPSVGSTHYGGTVAAPTAANIIRKSLVYLGVPSRIPATAKRRPSTKTRR